MAIYHFQDSPLIERLEISAPYPGATRAVIIAGEKAGADQLEKLRQDLGESNISTLMDNVDGRAAIQLRGFQDEKALLKALSRLGLTNHRVERETTSDDARAKSGFFEKVRNKSLFLSALFYDLGNLALVISGIQRGRHNPGGKFTSKDITELSTGVAFSVGDLLMTAYGHEKGDEELKVFHEGLKTHLQQQGIAIPEGDALNPESLHRSDAMAAISDYLSKNIVKVKCLTEFVGGALMMHAGTKIDPEDGQRNPYKMAAGALLATGWLSTFFLDKPRSQRIMEGPPPTSLVDKVKDNPRGWIARPLSILNNFSNIVGADRERIRFRDSALKAETAFKTAPTQGNREKLALATAKQHDYIWNVLTAGSFIVAHTLFGLSGSKRPQQTDDDVRTMDDLVLLSANLLAKQPEQLRTAAIENTADYISKIEHVNLGKEEIARYIREKVEDLSQTRWAERIQPASSRTSQPGISA